MRRTITALLAIGLVAGALTASVEAKPRKRTRTASYTYDAPALGAGAGVCLGATNSCGNLTSATNEKYLKVTIKDQTGLPVWFSLGQDTDPDAVGTEHDLGEFCGTTGKKPIPILPGEEVVVFPWILGVSCQSVATTGTVTLKFSNLP